MLTYHLAVFVLGHGLLIRKAAILKVKSLWYAVSLERFDGVWIGSHSLINVGDVADIERRLLRLADEWQLEPHTKVLVQSNATTMTG